MVEVARAEAQAQRDRADASETKLREEHERLGAELSAARASLANGRRRARPGPRRSREHPRAARTSPGPGQRARVRARQGTLGGATARRALEAELLAAKVHQREADERLASAQQAAAAVEHELPALREKFEALEAEKRFLEEERGRLAVESNGWRPSTRSPPPSWSGRSRAIRAAAKLGGSTPSGARSALRLSSFEPS